MENMKKAWDFVEKYHPDYSSCTEIAYNNDLHKILKGEIEGNSEVIYNEIKEDKKELYNNTLNCKELNFAVIRVVTSLYEMTLVTIYEEAIKGFINSNN
jgi:phosphoribosyl-ATP pyrophosphohydrolase